MTHFGELATFAGIIVLGQFCPGQDMVLITRASLRDGISAGTKIAAGITCGLCAHATIAVGGVAMIFERFPVLRRCLQWIAAIYMLWLAYGMLKEAFSKWKTQGEPEEATNESVQSPFFRGMWCNLLNPKVALFLAAVCAPFLSKGHPSWWPFVIWAIIVGLGLGLWSLWAVLLQWGPLRRSYETAGHWVDGIFGVVLTLLSIRLMIG